MQTLTTGKPPEKVPQNGDRPLSAPGNRSASSLSVSQPVRQGQRTSGTIASFLRFARVGRRQFVELARLAVKLDPKLAPIMEDWDRMKPSLQNATSLDALCEAHDVDPVHFISAVGEAAMRFQDNACIIIVASNMPAIVAASVKRALTPGGVKDRKMLFEHAGFLPVPANREVRMLNRAAIKAELNIGDSKPLPRFESTMEMLDKLMEDDK